MLPRPLRQVSSALQSATWTASRLTPSCRSVNDVVLTVLNVMSYSAVIGPRSGDAYSGPVVQHARRLFGRASPVVRCYPSSRGPNFHFFYPCRGSIKL